ncbi:MAG: hypothetical protein EHM39_09370 [Chloroflexi bacterium]|nr:MAG: hypothetical protein EHM39_09370 [Chloroflexota bacterium]
MAKKTRKTNRPNVSRDALERARREMQLVPAEPEAAVDAVKAAPTVARSPRKLVMVPRVVNLREEYAYVLQDLRNMAILAVCLMVVLTIMSLFI